MTEGD